MMAAMSRHPKSEPAAVTLPAAASAAVKLGTLLRSSVPGALVVEYEGSGALPARSTIALDEQTIARATATHQPALLLFENGDPRLPIIVGLIQPDPGAALLQSLLVPGAPTQSRRAPAEARLDGKTVVLEGKEEVTLKCGAASITLRRDGKVILRGAYVETTAKGVNRIRGGSVKIN
jgi:hypothetical protein